MNYIVFDLEWNQCPGGKAKENPRLPFEILEIGAIKLNDKFEEISRFQEVIRPLVYHHLHFRMKEVVPVSEEELREARTFSRVARDFLEWIGGEPYKFVTWGNLDVFELQRNLDYYKIKHNFGRPVLYFDLQKQYSILYKDGKKRLALEEAVDEMDIEKDIPFHRALDDSYYTAAVMRQMDFESVREYESVDYYHLPQSPSDEIYLNFPTYSKYVSRVFEDKHQAMTDKYVTAFSCPKCKLPVWRKIKWFSTGTNGLYLGVVKCPRHGFVKSKIRLKKLPDERVFAVKTTKITDEATAEAIKNKRLALQEKRRRLRQNKKTNKNS